jgi:hypothetical protein
VRRARVILGAATLVVVVASSFLACASDARREDAGVVPEAGAPEVPAIAEEAAPPPPSGYDGGVGLGLADVADTPCAPRGGPMMVVLPSAPAPPVAYRSLQQVGERRVADAADGSGFVVLDASGAGAARTSSAPLGLAATAVLGSQIVLGGRTGENLNKAMAQVYDPMGTAAGSAVFLANEYPDTIPRGAAGVPIGS